MSIYGKILLFKGDTMITLTKEIALNKQNQLYMSNYDSDTLIFDIETTGLSKSYSMIYIIGFATIKNNSLYFTQLFAETKEDEAIVIDTFSKELAKYKRLVTFNGNRFDIPEWAYPKCGS